MKKIQTKWRLLLLISFLPALAWASSSATFYAAKTSNTPSGSGMIYVYRGGQTDVLPLSVPEWYPVETGQTFTINMDQNNPPDGYKKYDPKQTGYYNSAGTKRSDVWNIFNGCTKYYENQGVAALHVYFYAKPNPGYLFEGWYNDEAGTSHVEASTDHYPIPNPAPGTITEYNPVRWDNGGTNPDIPASGDWQDFKYTRYVPLISGNSDYHIYAKFSLIARPFVLVGTGFEDVSYTAGSYNVGAGNITTSDLTSDIALSISYDANKYIFSGWQWSEGSSGTKYDFAETASATYVLNDNTAAARGLQNDARVYIWPNIKEKAAGVDVIYNEKTTSYETWEEALAAAKAEGVSGATIRLKKDITGISVAQAIDRSMTIDLNGRTFSGTANNLLTISGSGTNVTITDGTISQVGRLELNIEDVATTYAVTVRSGAQLTIAGGTIYSNNTKSDGTARGVEAQSGTTLTMAGGTVEAQSLQNAYALINRGTTTINSGSLYAHTTTAATAVAFYNVGTSAVINGGSFLSGAATTTSYGIQQNVANTLVINNATVRAEAATSTAYALARSNGVIVVNDGKFNAVAPSTVASVNVANKSQVTLRGGVYRTYNNVRQCAAEGYDCYELDGGIDYEAGYRFQIKAADAHPRAFKVIEIGKTTYYESLQDALAYANNNPNTLMSIIMIAFEHTLPAGNYTIPNQASLIIPRNVDQTGASQSVDRVDAYTTPSLFRKITFANGVRMEVYGTIEAGGTQNSAGQGRNGAGVPSGAYGQIELQEGSKIILNNGARLNAWGFVTGNGEIDARRGSQVYEQFQMFDWKGGKNAGGMLNNNKNVFPVNQYAIQNVEVPTTFHPGSALTAMTSIYVSSARINCDNVKIVGVTGSGAMFLMDDEDDSENTWVRKSYDVEHDQQVYAVNSSAHLGSIVIELMGVPVIGDLNFDSKKYTLPVTSNLKIHLLSGYMDITQSTVLIPGAEIEIDKTATVTINSGQSLYLYDEAEWGTYVFSNAYAQPVLYTPSAPLNNGRHTPVARAGSWVNSGGWWYTLSKPASASINVHGTFDVEGALYTTAGGANIFSTNEDAGTVYFGVNAAADGSVSQPTGYEDGTITNTPVYETRTCTSAKLKNAAGYTTTKGAAKAGDSYCYIQDAWRNLKTEGCFVFEVIENETIYYAKPADYVALKNGNTEEPDHTYLSADGTRTFILVVGCQWWEVVYHEASGLFYCDKNKTYYYYDDSNPNPAYHEWKPKTYSVTWQNWNGTNIESYDNAHYGSMPEYLGSTPKRTKDDYYTYDFTDWAPAISPVTADVTYIAQYERKDRMYTITWKDELGNTIESDYCKMGQIPECHKAPDMTNKEWNPAVSAVTGDQIYQLTAKNNDGPFTIKFVNWNWDGTDEHALKIQSVAKTNPLTAPTPPAAPEKAALADVAFEFAGWRAADNTVYAPNATLPGASENAIYTATFTEKPITYTITWKNYDGATLETDENVTPHTVPQYNDATPTKPSDETYHYTFSGWSPTVVPAAADAAYIAQFTATPKDKIVNTNEPIESGVQQTVTNLIIETTGTLTIPTTSRINATNLILEATSNASGQLITNANTSINVTGNAYFDWTPNGETGTAYRTWYAIAVPWEVDAENGIFLKETGRHLVIGQDFDLIYYDGATRASQGNKPACWKYVQHDENKTMHPGQLYMMYFDPGFKTIRFAKNAGADVMYMGSLNVNAYPETTNNDDKDGGWNGIANPRTYFASLSAGTATYAQVLNNGNLDDYFGNSANPVYQTINLSASHFTVGKPVFIQATGNDPVVVTKQTTAGIVNSAPRRARAANLPQGIEVVYRLAIAGADEPEADNLFVQVAEDEKADRYTIGQDLVKGGVASGRAQVWVNRYDAKLSVNTQALSEDEATYPLTIQVPANGDYVLSVGANENEDYALYLTRDGEAIWNLSEGAYTANLEKGAHTNYGLRVSARAPQITTGIDEAVVDAKGETRKVMINDKVFIIRGENVYSVDGQLVK